MNESSFADILLAVVDRLVAYLELAAGQVGIVLDNDVAPFVGERDILVMGGHFTAAAQGVDAGRTFFPSTHDLHVVVRTRSNLDQADRSTVLLTDESLGHYRLVESVALALHTFWPRNSDNQYLTKRGILLRNGSPPQKTQREGFAETTLVFEVEHVLSRDREEFDP